MRQTYLPTNSNVASEFVHFISKISENLKIVCSQTIFFKNRNFWGTYHQNFGPGRRILPVLPGGSAHRIDVPTGVIADSPGNVFYPSLKRPYLQTWMSPFRERFRCLLCKRTCLNRLCEVIGWVGSASLGRRAELKIGGPRTHPKVYKSTLMQSYM